MSLGAKGVVSVLSNLCPVEAQLMAQAALNGDFDTAAALQIKLLPLIDLLFCEVNPIPVKYVAAIKGLCAAEYRLPLCPPSPESAKLLQDLFY